VRILPLACLALCLPLATPSPASAGFWSTVGGAAASAEATSLESLSGEASDAAIAVGKPDYDDKLARLKVSMSHHKVVGHKTVLSALEHTVAEKIVPLPNAQKVAGDLGLDPSKVVPVGYVAPPKPKPPAFVPDVLVKP